MEDSPPQDPPPHAQAATQPTPPAPQQTVGQTEPPILSDTALDEALRQIEGCVADEDDRRKVADSKLTNAQGAVGFVITLATGALIIGSSKNTPDGWHIAILAAVFVAVGFFLWASWWVMSGLNPAAVQKMTIDGIVHDLYDGLLGTELKRIAIDLHASNATFNIAETNRRLTCYRAASENIFKGVVSLSVIPIIVAASIAFPAATSIVKRQHPESQQSKRVPTSGHVIIKPPLNQTIARRCR